MDDSQVGEGPGLRKEEQMWSGVGLEKFLVMKYTTPSVGHGAALPSSGN